MIEPSNADLYSCPETVQNYIKDLQNKYYRILENLNEGRIVPILAQLEDKNKTYYEIAQAIIKDVIKLTKGEENE